MRSNDFEKKTLGCLIALQKTFQQKKFEHFGVMCDLS